jgi:hypothetical protein
MDQFLCACSHGIRRLRILSCVAAPMRQLRVFRDCLSAFAVWHDVIHGAVIKRMNLVVAELADGRSVVKVFSELEIEKSRLNQGALEDLIDESSELRPCPR